MGEADLLEASTNYMSLTLDVLSFYMTITSGYLIAAFLAGVRLTRSQVFIVSTLYIFMAVVATYALFAFLSRGTQLSVQHASQSSNLTLYASDVIVIIMTACMAAGILASLIFMRNIRQRDTE